MYQLSFTQTQCSIWQLLYYILLPSHVMHEYTVSHELSQVHYSMYCYYTLYNGNNNLGDGKIVTAAFQHIYLVIIVHFYVNYV